MADAKIAVTYGHIRIAALLRSLRLRKSPSLPLRELLALADFASLIDEPLSNFALMVFAPIVVANEAACNAGRNCSWVAERKDEKGTVKRKAYCRSSPNAQKDDAKKQ